MSNSSPDERSFSFLGKRQKKSQTSQASDNAIKKRRTTQRQWQQRSTQAQTRSILKTPGAHNRKTNKGSVSLSKQAMASVPVQQRSPSSHWPTRKRKSRKRKLKQFENQVKIEKQINMRQSRSKKKCLKFSDLTLVEMEEKQVEIDKQMDMLNDQIVDLWPFLEENDYIQEEYIVPKKKTLQDMGYNKKTIEFLTQLADDDNLSFEIQSLDIEEIIDKYYELLKEFKSLRRCYNRKFRQLHASEALH